MISIISVLLSALIIVLPMTVMADSNFQDISIENEFLSEYVQNIFEEDSIIPVSQVKSVLQTSEGYLWIAGYQGLMRYNGMDTKVFSENDGFPTLNVNILYEDSQQRLWIGTNDNGVIMYDKKEFHIFGIEQGMTSASVRDIVEGKDGNIVVATTNGIAVISSDFELTMHHELDDGFVTHIEYAGNGRFYALQNDGDLLIIDEQKIIAKYGKESFGDYMPISLYYAGNDMLYIGTTGSIVIETDGNISEQKVIETTGIQNINRFYNDDSNKIWICADNGIGYIKNDEFTQVDGLKINNSIECICKDYEGNYWIGSSRQGLMQLIESKFTDISFNAKLPDYTVNTTALWNKSLYIGTDDGIIILKNNEQISNEISELLQGIRIRCLFTDSKDRLWICTYEKYGVIVVEKDGTFKSINTDSGLAANKVRCITEADNGDMIVGMSGGVSIIRNDSVLKTYTKADGLSNDVILSLCQDNDGYIYAGSDGGGIYKLDGDNITNYTEKDGLAAGIILRMTVIDDTIWISTGNSICIMDDNEIHDVTKLKAFSSNVFEIIDAGDKIWFLHTNGVVIVLKSTLLSNYELVVTQLTKKDGLSSTVTPNSWNELAEDGTLYISTAKGVLSVNTKSNTHHKPKPFAGVSEVYIDGKSVVVSDNITIPKGAQRIRIHLDLLSYASGDGTITYFLNGFDNDFTTSDRTDSIWVSYTNLKGGKYTFCMFGTNSENSESDMVTITFNKEYEFLEQPLTRVMLILLATAFVVFCTWFVVTKRLLSKTNKKNSLQISIGNYTEAIADLIDSKSKHTEGHSKRVAAYSRMVGMRLGMTEDELDTLYYSALMHNIGKITVPDRILEQSGVLKSEDQEIYETHVVKGNKVLDSMTVFGDVGSGVMYHHENIDGTGYPKKLAGSNIPLNARIIRVCNSFDNMVAVFSGKKGYNIDRIQSVFIHNAGIKYDEKITAILISLIDEGVVPIEKEDNAD